MAFTSGTCSSTTRSRRARRAACWAFELRDCPGECSVRLALTGFTGTGRGRLFVPRSAGAAAAAALIDRTGAGAVAATLFNFIIIATFAWEAVGGFLDSPTLPQVHALDH